MLAAEAAIDAVIRHEQIEHRGNQRLALDQLQFFHRHIADEHAGMICTEEMIVLAVAKIGEADRHDVILDGAKRQSQLDVLPV